MQYGGLITDIILICLQTVETLTEPALNKFFSILTTMIPYLVFAISVVLGIVGLIRAEVLGEAHNRGSDYGCFMFDLIDVTLLTINFLIPRTKW